MVSEEVIKAVKRKLHITWNNEHTNSEVKILVTNTEAYLNHMLGAEVDYDVPGMENMLFLEACSYGWNDCMNEFEEAYATDLIRCRAKYEVNYAKENPEAE